MSDIKRMVNIIPLTRVNLKNEPYFTYLVPLKFQDQVRPGQLAKIPFGRRMIYGITSSFELHRITTQTKGLKNFEDLVGTEPTLSEKQLELGKWLANYYICSLGLALKLMLPKPVKKIQEPRAAGYERYNPDFVLTEHQRKAVTTIINDLGKAGTVLLHGVTGSGKTEVYMQVVARVIDKGQQVIILVPEISLTEPAIQRFAKRFGMQSIALLHSRLKSSERGYMWQKIRRKEKTIIIGPRSAIFAPVQNLGLLIIDEEHDPSFKQYDQAPRYHAVTIAKKLSKIWSCPLILGDATPSVETYYEAASNKIGLLELPHRIKADLGMPKVHLIDMREEAASGNFSVFSNYLKLAILDNLKNQKQIILFLNRRGTANFLMCRDCGFVPVCDRCSVSLVWHQYFGKLICHHCGGKYESPLLCPECQGIRLKHYGVGTQLIEEELKKFLQADLRPAPMPTILRMDRDTTREAGTIPDIYDSWSKGRAQILIGTQMISKGWDVSRVGLVGIISGDTSLYLPDFRSNERTFQILVQVAGRTGRGAEPGLVILQTYHPENYAIQAAKLHDYQRFFQTEIKERQRFFYPPFAKFAKLLIKHQDADKALKRSVAIVNKLLKKPQKGLEILGPVPAFIFRLRGKYQYQIILRMSPELNLDLFDLLKDLPTWVDIDVDPISLL
jgi:primosomal protein N' (replication factor Y)